MADTCWFQASDPGPFPELGKADTRSGKGAGSLACSQYAAWRAWECGLEPRHFNRRLRARHWTHGSSDRPLADCMRRADSRALARIRSGAVSQAFDPVVLPERVSAFPSSGRTTGSNAMKKGHELASVPSSSPSTGALARRFDQRAAIFQSFAISANFGSLTSSNAFCAAALSPLRFNAMPSSISALSASVRPPLAMAFCSAADALA